MTALDTKQGLAKAMCITLGHHGAKLQLGRKVMVHAGFPNAHNACYVLVRKPVVTQGLDQVFGSIGYPLG